MAYPRRTLEMITNTTVTGAMPDTVLMQDPQTERFRENLRLVAHGPATHHLAREALAYANEAEARILDLNARIRQLEMLTQTDELTGLLNRRGFDDVIRRNLSSAARYDETGLLAYIDLNGFKTINDQYGHMTGDAVLRAVGAYLKKNIRTTDYAARLGGDEFAILFVRASLKPARERAKELVRGISKLAITCKSKKIAISASLGLAAYKGDTKAESLIEQADRAMYADKKHGGRAARLTTNG
ncbi:GGDEF domain-containing protein [Parvibaculum sp.]|jgi:diguanylate cyclase (GGDEF)-like protein|uniref:GGDEF domain-containing protein n=1 Tax=Parvibaculum sp. TaxID=2024848 RepID=UPI003C75038F